MWRKNAVLLLLLTLTSVLLSPGCATLTRESTQRIPVTSSPAVATVFVNGVNQGVTPREIRLGRKQKGQVIRIESPGYNPVEIRPEKKLSGGVVLSNFLLGLMPGLLPAAFWSLGHPTGSDAVGFLIWGLSAAAFGGWFTAIDINSGIAYGFRPTDLTVTLTKADGTPRVDTLLVDADDFQNIKWIRVHRD
jgi:hypothetical protein